MRKKYLNKKSWFTLLADNGSLDLYLYGTIGGWDITVDSLQQSMRGYENTPITVYLSSTGGYFEDGLPIYNMLKQHKADVTVIVMGFALSMASVIMLAGNTVKACNNAIIMIHRAEGMVCGDAEDMRKEADVCEVHEEAIIPIYMAKMQQSAKDVFALMCAETWYNADDALEVGLIDEIIDPVDMSAIDAVLPPDELKTAVKNFKHVPPELSLATEDDSNKNLLLKILNAVVGNPAPKLHSLSNDLDMTPEELKVLLAENNKTILASFDEKLKNFKPIDAESTDDKADPAAVKMAELEEKISMQAKEIAMLKEQAPSTQHEENTGGNDDADSEGDKW